MKRNVVAVIAALAIIIGISAGVRTMGIFARAADLMNGSNAYRTVKRSLFSTGGDIVENKIDLNKFDTLKTDMASVDLYLEQGDGYSLEYHVRENYVPIINEDNGKLTIKQPSTFGIHINITDEQYYKLTVPKDAGTIDVNLDSTSGEIRIDKINVSGKIEITSGKIYIDGVATDELRLEATSGNIVAEDVIANKADIRFTSGDVSLKNFVANDLSVDMTSGDLIGDAVTFDNADLSATSGNIKVKATGDQEDYGYNLKATSGKIRMGDMEIRDKFKSRTDREKLISVDVTSCNVDVTFD